MKFILLTLSLLIINSSLLICENYLDTLWTQYGEMIEGDHTNYGRRMTTTDFNGDGIDDLVVEAGNNYFSKFYFYLGGDEFDNIADYTIFKAQDDTASYYPWNLRNIGDFNGDDYDDTMLIWDYYTPSVYRYAIQVYFGGPDFDTESDWTYIIIRDEYEGAVFAGFGDTNGDNCSDIAYVPANSGAEYEVSNLYIIYGDEVFLQRMYFFQL